MTTVFVRGRSALWNGSGLAALHGWSSYLLHDDFYDDNGQAAVPEATVDEAETLPYPPEEAWTASIALALDVAYTKWSLPPALVSVFAGARERTLDEIDARHDHILSLSWFSDPRAVDALESLVRSPLTDTWGRVAAACGLDWARARLWLESGRPLSLIALDALTFFVRYDTPLLRIMQPKLRDAPDLSELERHLAGYAERDPVPRVKRAVSFILANAHALATGSPTPACS